MDQSFQIKKKIIEVAAGREPADLVLKNAVFVNVFTGKLQKGDIAITQGVIAGIGGSGRSGASGGDTGYHGRTEIDMSGQVICPGLIDAHIHLESSLAAPVEFAKAVIPHGTTAVITDPHEIANVMGTAGIDYMMEATCGLPLDVFFMLPSCVPATPMDESGACLSSRDIARYYSDPRVLGLAEMMDFFGVVKGNEECLRKLLDAEAGGRMIDGHAPSLKGKELNAYIAAGISTDHECSDVEEAMEKIERGQMVMIREGTAAHNLDALIPLLTTGCADHCMFCSDDKHPSDLLRKGHIDELIRRSVAAGVDPIQAIKAGSFNTARHFRLCDRGAVAPGYRADLTVVDDLDDFHVVQVFKNGQLVFDESGMGSRANEGRTQLVEITPPVIRKSLNDAAHDTFRNQFFQEDDFRDSKTRAVIGTVDGEIRTTRQGFSDRIQVENDILKVAVIERHRGSGHFGIGYLRGYGLRSGAVATSFSHDSHNIIVIGTSDRDMAMAVNRLTENRGGIVVENDGEILGEVKLGIAGLMSDEPLEAVERELESAKAAAKSLGVNPAIDPFMTLSFLSLPVIPELRITTRGVFDVTNQKYI
ncbi:MAG: adenine deaminase [Eubacterium sp.]|nr:adenine deaminase [Eubacterium sp.]MCI2196469.1 adenine deaminase [Eubacterium sp.]